MLKCSHVLKQRSVLFKVKLIFLAGLMNPGGRQGSLIAVLTVLQWIDPFMSIVSRGGN